jgi:two-component system response regulator AtoC
MSRPRLLVVDDKATFLSLFEKIVGERMDVHLAGHGAKALGLLAVESFDVVVTDIRMPGVDGMALLAQIKARSPDIEVILVTGYGTIPQAVEAMQGGAFSYLTKPFDPDVALATIVAAVARRRERQRDRSASRTVDPGETWLSGRSELIVRVWELASRAAAARVPVLLLGEIGTGKQALARLIHRQCPVASQPFHLIRATDWGLDDQRVGTVFLPDVDRLPKDHQDQLLAELRDKPSLRWIFASQEPLDETSAEHPLLEALAAETGSFPITLPPLRERQEDIPLIASSILSAMPPRDGEAPSLTSEALAALVAYDWPENVRELAQTLDAMARRTTAPRIGIEAVPEEVRRAPNLRADPARLVELTYREVIDLARERTTRDYLVELLRAARGNVTRAAQRADIERESLHRLMRRFHLRAEDFRSRRD